MGGAGTTAHRRRRRHVALAVVTIVVSLGAGGSAQAAIQVGQTGPPTSLCGSGNTLQGTEAGPPSYVIPSPGVLTAWRHNASTTFTARLQVWNRPSPDPLTLVGRGETVETFVAGGLREFPTRVPVSAGNVIGIHANANYGCAFATVAGDDVFGEGAGADYAVGQTMITPSTLPARRVNLAATLEPDCDGDSFGDETQDAALGGLVCSGGRRCAGKVPTHVGTESPDVIRGTPNRDVVLALGGDDDVRAGGGKDLVCGNVGRDTLLGENGHDKLLGGEGRDALRGGKGRDKLGGGKGRDSLRGGKGRDKLRGGKGRDKLRGGKGRDRCRGGAGRDRAKGCERGKVG